MSKDLIQWCHKGYVYNPSFIGDQVFSHDVHKLTDDGEFAFFYDGKKDKLMTQDQFIEFVNYMIECTALVH
tara:strand:- start:855 stop:1067 length:213 start_codon:yes stop_codon:yes gene_type:complete